MSFKYRPKNKNQIIGMESGLNLELRQKKFLHYELDEKEMHFGY